MDTVKIKNKNKTVFIAHRGLSGIYTENTLIAFEEAGKRTYYGIECDVHVTRDGKYVIFHDDNTGRLCKKDLIIEDTDFDTLRSLEFKDGVSKMPTLEEYLQVVAEHKKTAVIELKNAMPEKNIYEITEICRSKYSLEKIIFISFVFDNLKTLRKLLPNQKIQYLTFKCDGGLIKTLKENGFDIDIEYGALTKEAVKKLHKNGIAVNCWTCDDIEQANELISQEVDFITTNILEN